MSAARNVAWFTLLIILSQLVIACGRDADLVDGPRRGSPVRTGEKSSYQGPQTYPVDPLFADFYAFLGGERRMGPAISTVLGSGNQKQQYIQAGLLVFDGSAPISERYQLAPLGKQFIDASDPETATAGLMQLYAGDVPVHTEFEVDYAAMGGARFAGKALGEARYNPVKGRFEQYFENIGFYRLDGDDKVRLMAFGASACDFRCRYQPPVNSIPIREVILPEPYAGRVKALGQSYSGAVLRGPRIALDGQQEVIFENIVLVLDNANPGGISARPLPELVGVLPQSPVPRNADPLMVFYPLEVNLGHNVPAYFNAYLQQHGGLEVSGMPVTEVIVVEPGLYRQCFTNLCLDFNLNAGSGEQLRPTPLGTVYVQRAGERQVDFTSSQSLEGVDLQIWEGRTFVSSTESQEVNVAVFEDGRPLKNREPVVYLTLPDGSPLSYHFPPTGEDGLSALVLPAIAAPNGTLITYQVCLQGLAGERVCAGDNFMVWNHP